MIDFFRGLYSQTFYSIKIFSFHFLAEPFFRNKVELDKILSQLAVTHILNKHNVGMILITLNSNNHEKH